MFAYIAFDPGNVLKCDAELWITQTHGLMLYCAENYHGDEKFTYIVLDPPSVVCDVELWVRHAWLVIQRITTVVKVTLLQE